MGLNKRGAGGNYFRVAYGAIRRKCQEGEVDAESRTTKDGEVVWEKVWPSLTGTLIGITHEEHQEYGRSWRLHVQDGAELYTLQIQEDSRYGNDLLKKIPLLKIGTPYTFTPYDFTPKGEDKKKVGFSITDETTGEKIQSYFHEFTKGKDGKWIVKYLNGFPDPGPTADFDKDDWKAFNIRATKVMRTVGMNFIHVPAAIEQEAAPVNHTDSAPPLTADDLPF
jgi:hypothetical protein